MRRIRSEHPRWTYHAAARYYAEKNPPSDIQPASLARRLADKLKREDGVDKRKATTKQLLQGLEQLLLHTLVWLRKLNEEE